MKIAVTHPQHILIIPESFLRKSQLFQPPAGLQRLVNHFIESQAKLGQTQSTIVEFHRNSGFRVKAVVREIFFHPKKVFF